MEKDKIKHFKNRLLEEKKTAINAIKMMERHHPPDLSLKEYMGELSFYDNQPADYGSELFIMTMQAGLKKQQHHRIIQINKALEKIEDGTYGNCQSCGANISKERLELMPEANTCIKCAENKSDVYKFDTDKPVEKDQ